MPGDPKRGKRNPRNAFGLRRPFGLSRVGSGQAETKKNARPVRAGREDIRSRALPISFWREELQVRHFRTKNKAKLLPDNRAEQRKSPGLSSAALKCFELGLAGFGGPPGGFVHRDVATGRQGGPRLL